MGMTETWASNATAIAVALGIGLLIGIERERRKGVGAVRAAAGVRSFTLIALMGAVAQLLDSTPMLILAGAHVIVLAAVSYHATREHDPGITTELAMFWTFMLGVMATTQPLLAAALAVVSGLILLLRQDIHHFSAQILTAAELRSALLLLAAVLIVLPVLPSTPIDPWQALSLRKIWLVAIMLMAVSSLSHIALRSIGPKYGLLVSMLASGFISGVATFTHLARSAKIDPIHCRRYSVAATVSYLAGLIQAALILFTINAELLRQLYGSLVAAACVPIAYGLFHARTSAASQSASAESLPTPSAPFDYKVLVSLVAMLSVVTLITAALAHRFGAQSVLMASAISGLMDSHAAIASVASLTAQQQLTLHFAALGALIALSSSVLGKMLIARLGGRQFALQITLPSVLLMAALWLPWWLHT
jgi:uncharacterized membrane protein (DUF4010 family)